MHFERGPVQAVVVARHVFVFTQTNEVVWFQHNRAQGFKKAI